MADVDAAKVKTKGNANHTRRSYTFPSPFVQTGSIVQRLRFTGTAAIAYGRRAGLARNHARSGMTGY